MSASSSSSSLPRNSGTPARSTVEWKGTSMPGTRMKARLPPNSATRRTISVSSASSPRTVPAMAYWEPRRFRFTTSRYSPAWSAISATKPVTSASASPNWLGRIAAMR